MPYIPRNDRYRINAGGHPRTPGELNYKITATVDEWIGSVANYERLNAAIGVLECAKQELYRKVLADYEDTKCEANGTVYRDR